MLKVYKDHNIGFFHIPRTAGGTVTKVFKQHLGPVKMVRKNKHQHETMQWCADRYDISGLCLVTSIRNPYDQVVSLYYWLRRGRYNKYVRKLQEMLRPENLKTHDMDFGEFTGWYCDYWRSYWDWLQIDGEISDYHYIIKENLKEDLCNFLKIEVKGEWRWWHKTKRDRDYRNYYTQQYMYDRITDKHRWCFDMGFYDRR